MGNWWEDESKVKEEKWADSTAAPAASGGDNSWGASDSWGGGGGGSGGGSWGNSWEGGGGGGGGGGESGGWQGGGGGGGGVRAEWGEGGKRRKATYSKELSKEHAELKEMWTQMCTAMETASEESLPGVLETVHSAITSNFESDHRLFNNGELSRIFEKVIDWSGSVHIRGLYFKIIHSLPELLQQRCGSRVVEKLFRQAHHLLQTDPLARSADEEDATGLPTLTTLLSRTVDTLIEGDEAKGITLVDLLQDTAATHPIRILLHVLAGVTPPLPNNGRNQRPIQAVDAAAAAAAAAPTPLGDGTAIKKFGKAIVKELAASDIFANRCRAVPVSGMLQVLIKVWQDGSKPLYEQIAKDASGLLKNNVSSHIVEAALMSDRGHSRLHAFFLENWKEGHLNVHAVSKWAAGSPTEAIYAEVLASLEKDATYIKDSGHMAIVVGAAEAAAKYPSHQSQLINLVLKVTDTDVNGLAKELLGLQQNATGSKAGFALLAHLLAFGPQKIGKIYRGVLDVKKQELITLVCDSSFGYVAANFIKFGGEKDLKKFSQCLDGKLFDICSSGATGCIAVERLFDKLSITYRRKIAEELALSVDALNQVWHTQKLVKKLRLDQFKHRLTDWEEAEKKLVKKNKMLQTILGTEATSDAQVKTKKNQKRKRDGDDE
eukprot:Rhum_TRINITY_DN8328_c0_g1::Rhum_TRINITY_DN8328_c0_g1_i1::g.27383::m.27383/K14790/NOP9; nucleolar protein 9